MKRAVHFDFHTQGGIDNLGENFDAAKFARLLSDANVTYINAFARCNMGYSYYPTKVGVPHPYLKGNRLGDMVRECHKLGIGVTGYINVGLNHELSARHPEWLQVNKDGQIYNFANGGNFFRTVCYNTGYADHLLAEIAEVLDEGVDGLFCDCFKLRPCYCQKCLSDMVSLGIDINDEAAVTDFANSARIKIMQRARRLVPENIRLVFTGSLQWPGKDINSHFEVESLPASWGYEYFLPNAAYARTLYDEVVYMNGRFQTSWGDFGGYKGRAAIENDFYDGLTQGVTTMLGDHLYPADLPDADIYRELGEIYSEIEKYERWTDGAKYIPELAVLTNEFDVGNMVYGAARMLAELKYDFDVVYVEGDFSKYPVIIIPDDIFFDEKLTAKVRAYIDNGGKVISSGFSGIRADKSGFALPEWELDYLGDDANVVEKRVITPDEASFTTYFTLNFETPDIATIRYSEYDTAIKMRARDGAVSLADEIGSYWDKGGWDGRHYIFYTPPKEKTGNSALAVNSKGNVAHFSFKLFNSYMFSFAKVYKLMLKKVLEAFIPENLIKADELPSTARATLTGNAEYKLLHVKTTYPELRGTLGIVEEHTVMPAGRHISVKGDYTSVTLLPSETRVPFVKNGAYTEITLPEINGYAMLCLK